MESSENPWTLSPPHRSETHVRSGSTKPPPRPKNIIKKTTEATKDQTSKTATATEPKAAKAAKAPKSDADGEATDRDRRC